MWFPFATDLPCLHCEAVQSTWSYMSVMCLAFLGFALAAGCLFTRISFFLDSVFPFSALFGSVNCSHLVFTIGQQLPEATGLILTWPPLSAGLPFGLAQTGSNAGIFTFLGTTTCHCPREQQLTMLYAGKSLSWCLASSWTATNPIRQNPLPGAPLLLWPAPDRHAKAIPIASCNTTQWEAPTMQWWK